MSITANTIQPNKKARGRAKRVGRGNGSGIGTYSGKGMKGQKSRSGNKNTMRVGFKASLQKMPKLRGFKSLAPKKATVTLEMLERGCDEGANVTPAYLEKKGIIAHGNIGVKIVARGELKKKLNIQKCVASKGALEAIEKAGGSVTF
ncbi:50S ribosomal protein L15 [Candidatus Nomurabacteria bacterium]|nr:50S ribosomal protein L15 [Candidatus Nomurabacteria bacterium]